jgi:hypothetical protein
MVEIEDVFYCSPCNSRDWVGARSYSTVPMSVIPSVPTLGDIIGHQRSTLAPAPMNSNGCRVLEVGLCR